MLWLVGGQCLSFGFVCVRVYVLRFTTLYDSATMYDLLRCFGLSHDLLIVSAPNKEKVYGRKRFFGGLT